MIGGAARAYDLAGPHRSIVDQTDLLNTYLWDISNDLSVGSLRIRRLFGMRLREGQGNLVG